MTGKYVACKKVLSGHNILGSRDAKHPQHKSLSRNIKHEAATTKLAKWRQNYVATDFLGHDRDDNNARQCCNKNHNRNVVAIRKAGSRHQFEEANQQHCRNQENTIVIEIRGRTWKPGSRHQLAEAALKRCCDMGIDVATYMFEE